MPSTPNISHYLLLISINSKGDITLVKYEDTTKDISKIPDDSPITPDDLGCFRTYVETLNDMDSDGYLLGLTSTSPITCEEFISYINTTSKLGMFQYSLGESIIATNVIDDMEPLNKTAH